MGCLELGKAIGDNARIVARLRAHGSDIGQIMFMPTCGPPIPLLLPRSK
jgi:hypothetical protein